MRKPDAIDLVALYSKGDSVAWNAFLTGCYQKHDLEKLARTRRQLQAGMALLAKRKLNSEKMITFFIRLQNSIEITMKRIVREKMPNPCDDPRKAPKHLEARGEKRRRDHELERYLKKTGY